MDPKSLQLPHDYARKPAPMPQPEPSTPAARPPDRPVPWGLKAILWASITSLVLTGVCLFVVVVAVMIVGMVTGWVDPEAMAMIDPMEGDLTQAFDSRLLLVMMVGIFCLEGLMVPVAWFFGPRRSKGGLRQLGFRAMPLAKGLLYVVAGLGVTLTVNLLWSLLIEAMGWQDQGDVLGLFGDGVLGLLAALFAGGIVAPIAEEVFFRGFLYAGLRDRFARAGQNEATSIGLGILVSSVIFALIHVTPSVLIPIAFMGAVMAWLYEKTDSIWAPILLHAASNSLSFLLMFAAEYLG